MVSQEKLAKIKKLVESTLPTFEREQFCFHAYGDKLGDKLYFFSKRIDNNDTCSYFADVVIDGDTSGCFLLKDKNWVNGKKWGEIINSPDFFNSTEEIVILLKEFVGVKTEEW